jgi:hypothetical protein
MRVHFFGTATQVLAFDDPPPCLPACDYFGAMELSAEEVVELRMMAVDLRSDDTDLHDRAFRGEATAASFNRLVATIDA